MNVNDLKQLIRSVLNESVSNIHNAVERFEQQMYNKYPQLDRLGLYYDDMKSCLFLSDLYIHKQFRGGGVGSEIMNDVVRFADNNRLTIVLIPDSDEDDGGGERLIKFYGKFGFVVNTGPNLVKRLVEPGAVSMYRLPGGR